MIDLTIERHTHPSILREMKDVQPETLKRKFRERLRKIRTDAGMSQATLAEKIKAQQPYIAALESGDRSPTFETLAKLSEAFGISPRDLMPS